MSSDEQQPDEKPHVCTEDCVGSNDDGMMMLVKLMTYLIDKHYLASASISMGDIKQETKDRSLLIVVNDREGRINIRTCPREEYEAHLAKIQRDNGVFDS